jgi:hypothetical protein
MLENMSVSWWSTTSWMLLVREFREAGDGCKSVWMRSHAAAVATSAEEEVVGMVTLGRDQTRVSSMAMHLPVVSQIQTW